MNNKISNPLKFLSIKNPNNNFIKNPNNKLNKILDVFQVVFHHSKLTQEYLSILQCY